jgi:hypothetical protein
MEVILRLLKDLQMVLVAICAICCAAFIFTGLASMRDMRRAVFRLERSSMASRVMGSWLKAGLCALIGVGIIYITNNIRATPATAAIDNPLLLTPTPSIEAQFAATPLPTADLSNAALTMTDVPTQPELVVLEAVVTLAPGITDTAGIASTLVSTETPLPRITEVPTLTPLPPPTGTPMGQVPTAAAPAATAVVLPTLPPAPTEPPTPIPSPTPLPTNEPVAAAPAAPPEPAMIADCGSADAVMFNPAAGEIVTGGFPIRGTALPPSGGKYRIEILRPNIPGWAFLWENYNQVRDSVLMPSFNPRLFPPGVYTLRLMIVDGAGQETNVYCAVPFKIAE